MAVLMANQIKSSNKEVDERMINFEGMLEKTLRLHSRKMNTIEIGETSGNAGNMPLFPQAGDKEVGGGTTRVIQDNSTFFEVDPSLNLDSEEQRWGDNRRRENERRNIETEQGRGGTIVPLPRMDFPKFDGADPIMWKTNCESYFDMYQISEEYKIRMAVMNFDEELHEWYMELLDGPQQLPWDLLVEEVMSRFKFTNIKHPVDEFKRIHPTGKVEEYIVR